MANPERRSIHVRVTGGKAEPAAIQLLIGAPAAPFSVGTSAHWAVLANGVAPVHLFLAFDGQKLHAAAASPNLQVLMGGAPIGVGWVIVPLPCELRFGGACLFVHGGEHPLASSAMESTPGTVPDGGALWQEAAQRAAHAAKEGGFASPPAAPAPSAFGSTVLMGQRPPTPFTPPALGPTGGAPAASGPPATQPTPQGFGPPQRMPPLNVPSAEHAETPAPQDEKKGGYWRSASTVKKVTLVLMPVALIFAYFLLTDDVQKRSLPKRSSASASASAHGVPHAAGSVEANGNAVDAAARSAHADLGPAVTAVPTTSQGPPAASAPVASPSVARTGPASTKAGKRTPEREALDTVAAGSFDQAAKAYDTLVVAHPDDPTFKEAARILHEKAAHAH